MMTRPLVTLGLLTCLVCAAPAAALLPSRSSLEGITDLTIDGNKVQAVVELAGYRIDLTVHFEQAVGLTAESLGLSAQLVSATDPGLLSRLEDPLLSLPLALPLVITIEPPASGPLSFSGVASVELYTQNLTLTAGSPLRLFSAPLGGAFRDITEMVGTGSYRARGTTGGFSDFVILADARSHADVVDLKLAALDALLDAHATSIPGAIAVELDSLFAEAYDAWVGGDAATARQRIDAFAAAVASHGSSIPDVWRSARDLDNVAGQLRGAAATLRFSLGLAAAGS